MPRKRSYMVRDKAMRAKLSPFAQTGLSAADIDEECQLPTIERSVSLPPVKQFCEIARGRRVPVDFPAAGLTGNFAKMSTLDRRAELRVNKADLTVVAVDPRSPNGICLAHVKGEEGASEPWCRAVLNL